MNTRVLGIDNIKCASTHYCIAKARARCGDVAGALESARVCVRIYSKFGATGKYADAAACLLSRLETAACLLSRLETQV